MIRAINRRIGFPETLLAQGGASPVLSGQGGGVLTWPRLSPSSTTTDAAIGDLVGTLTMAAFGFPRLSPSSTTTDADTGDLVGTLKV